MSHLRKTKEMQQEHTLVRQMTVCHLIVNHHHESQGSLLDNLKHRSLCSPRFQFYSVNNPASNSSCVRHMAPSGTLQ